MSNNNYQIYHENDYCMQIDQTIISMVYDYLRGCKAASTYKTIINRLKGWIKIIHSNSKRMKINNLN